MVKKKAISSRPKSGLLPIDDGAAKGRVVTAPTPPQSRRLDRPGDTQNPVSEGTVHQNHTATNGSTSPIIDNSVAGIAATNYAEEAATHENSRALAVLTMLAKEAYESNGIADADGIAAFCLISARRDEGITRRIAHAAFLAGVEWAHSQEQSQNSEVPR